MATRSRYIYSSVVVWKVREEERDETGKEEGGGRGGEGYARGGGGGWKKETSSEINDRHNRTLIKHQSSLDR